MAENAKQNIQRIIKYAAAHKAQSDMADKILLLNRCLTISDAARPKSIKTTALKPCGVAATVSIKIPTISPDIVAVSSEQNIQIEINNVIGNKGFADAILSVKTLLY